MTLKLIAEQLINGLVLGSMYAIVASGLTLIWGTMKMLNFAHGELYMLGGYVLYFTLMVFGMHPFWAVFLALLDRFFRGRFDRARPYPSASGQAGMGRKPPGGHPWGSRSSSRTSP